MNKLLLLIIACIIISLIPLSVNAITTDDLVSYYKMDSGAGTTDSHASNTATTDADQRTNSFKLGTASYEGDDNQIFNTGINLVNNADWSVNGWFNSTQTGNYILLWGDMEAAGVDGWFCRTTNNDGTGVMCLMYGGGNIAINSADTDINDGSFHMITVTYDGTTNAMILYADNVSIGTNTNAYVEEANSRFSILTTQWNNSYSTTKTGDEIAVFDKVLNTTEIDDLWNDGDGLAYPFSSGGSTFFEVTALNNYTAAALTIFNATINGTFYDTTNGTINTNYNQSQALIFNITVRATNFTSSTYLNYNASVNLEAELQVFNFAFDWNMTSDGGCTAWRDSNTNQCNTTDGTPTTVFTTNKNATCSVRKIRHDYNSTYACSTTGLKSHICTLTFADRLVYDLSNLYFSCDFDDSSAETSSAMSINMTAGSGGGSGLVTCINVVGDSCIARITNNCAAIIKLT